MQQLEKWCPANPQPAFNDVESLTAIQMVSRLYAAMQALIKEVNAHIEQVNAATDANREELQSELMEFSHRFTCISNDLVQMCRDIRRSLDAKISDAVAEQLKALIVYDPETEGLLIKLGGETP